MTEHWQQQDRRRVPCHSSATRVPCCPRLQAVPRPIHAGLLQRYRRRHPDRERFLAPAKKRCDVATFGSLDQPISDAHKFEPDTLLGGLADYLLCFVHADVVGRLCCPAASIVLSDCGRSRAKNYRIRQPLTASWRARLSLLRCRIRRCRYGWFSELGRIYSNIRLN